MARVRKETTVTDIPDQNVVYTTQDEVHPYSTLFQILNLILGFISGVLLLRFILLMTGANPAAGFVQLIYQVSVSLWRLSASYSQHSRRRLSI